MENVHLIVSQRNVNGLSCVDRTLDPSLCSGGLIHAEVMIRVTNKEITQHY